MNNKWLKNGQGLYLSPEAQRSDNLHRAKQKKHKTHGDSYAYRKLTRLCPKCGAVIAKTRHLPRIDKLDIKREITVYICEKCNAVWDKKQINKSWQKLKRSSPKCSNKEFKQKLNII